MFDGFKKNADRNILINLCKNAQTVDDLFQNIPFAVSHNFEAEVINMKYNVVYKTEVSNSHSSPIDGVENFMRDKSKPLYYKGLQGHISFTVVKDSGISSGSSMFGKRSKHAIAGINLGSGGGNSVQYMKDGELFIAMSYSYDIKVFTDDFRFLKKAVLDRYEKLEEGADKQERLHKLKYPRRYYHRLPIKLEFNGSYINDKYSKLKK